LVENENKYFKYEYENKTKFSSRPLLPKPHVANQMWCSCNQCWLRLNRYFTVFYIVLSNINAERNLVELAVVLGVVAGETTT